MAKSDKTKSFYEKLRYHYRLSIFNEQTYEEVLGMRLSRLKVFTVVGVTSMLLIVLVILLIAFTGLREYIPGYPSGEERRMIVRNAQLVDSLVEEIQRRDRFFNDIKSIVNGEIPKGASPDDVMKDEKDVKAKHKIHFKKSVEDSLFRLQVEEQEKFNLSSQKPALNKPGLEQTSFFPPLKGVIVNRFGGAQGHYGVDIVAGPEARVSAVLDGTVFFAGWTVETGYVIGIQHSNNLVSFYKHNSLLLKKPGDRVKAGEAIAIVGNSGEFTTGPHLHFELWYNGAPLNPEEYMDFN
ncbi:MAG: M23 family metallopeptidase [Chlorobi bacterium]|nr:M23 family metallopeptidase [Chlorobiota bacterium]